MGSFNYTDFVTDMPITTISSDTYVLIIGESKIYTATTKMDNYSYINELIGPHYYPLFGTYNDYGVFVLDTSEYAKENAFAKTFLPDNILDSDGNLSYRHLEELGLTLMATHTALYKRGIESVRDINDLFFLTGNAYADGTAFYESTIEFSNDMTPKEIFDAKIKKFEEYLTIYEKEMAETGYSMVSLRHPRILKPNVNSVTNPHGVDFQNRLYDGIISDTDLYDYAFDWYNFNNFLHFVNKPFKAVSGLGRDDEALDQIMALKEVELEIAQEIQADITHYMNDN